jgi:HEAT repeat protein
VSLERIVAAYPRLSESDLREHYAFVLSQRREPEATDDLIALVRTDRDADVRRQAIFWLGQRKDPRARQYLADLILK